MERRLEGAVELTLMDHADAARSAPVPAVDCPDAAAGALVAAIDRMDEADLPSVLAIEQVSHPEPWREWAFRKELEHPEGCPLVARLGGQPGGVAGYLCGRRVVDELHIYNLAVAPTWRRRGIARRLLAEILATARADGLAVVVLEVRAGNEPARKLYESFGFRQVGERPCYYGPAGEAARLLELPLAGDRSAPPGPVA